MRLQPLLLAIVLGLLLWAVVIAVAILIVSAS
jgi:hypothetical protein